MLHFDKATLPWVDRETFAEEAARRAESGSLDAATTEQMRFWNENGYLKLSGALSHDLVDDLIGEYEAAWRDRPANASLLVEGAGVQTFAEVAPRETLTHHHYRALDFHEVSPAARRIMFHPSIVAALTAIFDQAPVGMQSLLFEYGSEQAAHQDFPYVVAHHLSHLVGCWIALEDVDDDNGPLFYFPGSHRLPLFDWGEGRLIWDGQDWTKIDDFAEYLTRASVDAGIEKLVLHAKKGDVLLWHSALAHGGSAVNDRERSRMSFVIHYSTREGYPRDRRWPDKEPTLRDFGGGFLYGEPAAD